MNLSVLKSFFCFCLILAGPLLIASGLDEVVQIPDPGLEKAIRHALDKTDGSLTSLDLASLRVLDAGGRNLTTTRGLEQAVNLTSLDLRFNQLTHLHLPQGTLALTNLNLGSNLLKDISFIHRMPDLQHLGLWGNRIDHIELTSESSNSACVESFGESSFRRAASRIHAPTEGAQSTEQSNSKFCSASRFHEFKRAQSSE